MQWKVDITQHWGELIRFTLKVAFVLNILMLAVFSVWFTTVFLWRLHRYLARVWLGHDW
jgi:hypothetical protein